MLAEQLGQRFGDDRAKGCHLLAESRADTAASATTSWRRRNRPSWISRRATRGVILQWCCSHELIDNEPSAAHAAVDSRCAAARAICAERRSCASIASTRSSRETIAPPPPIAMPSSYICSTRFGTANPINVWLSAMQKGAASPTEIASSASSKREAFSARRGRRRCRWRRASRRDASCPRAAASPARPRAVGPRCSATAHRRARRTSARAR